MTRTGMTRSGMTRTGRTRTGRIRSGKTQATQRRRTGPSSFLEKEAMSEPGVGVFLPVQQDSEPFFHYCPDNTPKHKPLFNINPHPKALLRPYVL